MLIKIENLPNRTCYAELSGAELEIFTRILGKMTTYDSEYLNGQTYFIERESNPTSLSIETKPPTIISQDRANDIRSAEQQKLRADHVEAIFTYAEQSQWGQARDEAKKLCEALYYHGDFITYNDRKEYAWEEGSIEHDVIDFFAENKPTIRVEKDGTVTKFPVCE